MRRGRRDANGRPCPPSTAVVCKLSCASPPGAQRTSLEPSARNCAGSSQNSTLAKCYATARYALPAVVHAGESPDLGSATKTVSGRDAGFRRFVLHAGLAFGAIHRCIYKPLRAGALRSGAPGRVKVLLKGAAAALFAVHELRLANNDALSSDLLRPLTNKIDGLSSKLTGLVGSLKSGSINPGAIAGASGATDALGSASSGLGVGIKDIPSAIS
jgi:hypothetical protein